MRQVIPGIKHGARRVGLDAQFHFSRKLERVLGRSGRHQPGEPGWRLLARLVGRRWRAVQNLSIHAAKDEIVGAHMAELLQEWQDQLRAALARVDEGQAPEK